MVRKACSKRRRSRLWSKLVNLRTCGLVSDFIAIVQAFAELRYGAVVHTPRKQCEIWAQLRPNPFFTLVFAHVYHYAISELCKGLYYRNGVWHESPRPQIHRFRPQAERERRRLEYAFLTPSSPTLRRR